MDIRVIDGIACSPRCRLNARLKDEHIERCPIPADAKGIFCFTEKEKIKLMEWLENRDIGYTVEEIAEPSEFAVTHDIRYASKAEALDHLGRGILPESERLKLLVARMEKVEKDVGELRKKEITRD